MPNAPPRVWKTARAVQRGPHVPPYKEEKKGKEEEEEALTLTNPAHDRNIPIPHVRLREAQAVHVRERDRRAREHLVADPVRSGRLRAHGQEQARRDARERRAGGHEGRRVAGGGDGDAAGEDAGAEGEDEGQVVHAGVERGRAEDGLEVEGEVVEEDEVGACEEELEGAGCADCAALDEAPGQHGVVALAVFPDC